ncbi:hypothetical protein BJP48_12745 [Paenibacillus odorifer]|uniref:Uncharacterized protein n=1 Tax=Paenibacillus odorifer TaxID=189426 RepID=A0ABX3HKB1_9BACL|nr:hypothetical protein BJP48_12745 [Paenibacillus odorifer]OMD50448.1 hypothetical protein BSK51_15850 [Paenibacillus odorifer]
MKEFKKFNEASKITKVSQRMMLWALHGSQLAVLKLGEGMNSRYHIPPITLVESIQRKGRN